MARSAPTSIRLSPADKRRIAAAARKRGMTAAAFIKRAALGAGVRPSKTRLDDLERLAAALLEAIQDERDYRLATESWESHLKEKTRLHTGEEVWRELGLPD